MKNLTGRSLSMMIIVFVLALMVMPLAAQEPLNNVSFNGFSFSYPSSVGANVNIVQTAGDAPDVAQPFVQPPSTDFLMYSVAPAPESIFDAPVAIRVYRTADLAAYENDFAQVTALQSLLATRPDLASLMTLTTGADIGGKALPYLPTLPAAQEIRARATYVQLGEFSGIAYVTSYGQDASPILASELSYTVQLLSNDGATYVSLVAKIPNAVIPNEIPADFDYEAWSPNIVTEFNNTISAINGAAPTDFAPSLDTLDAVVRSFSLRQATPPPVVAAPTQSAPPPTEIVNNDPTLGGLLGTWTLTSFGAVDAQIVAIAAATPTISFSGDGAAGFAGCNNYMGGFSYENGTVTFAALATTLMACEGVAQEMETLYLAALGTAQAYRIDGDTLFITYVDGMLTFARVTG